MEGVRELRTGGYKRRRLYRTHGFDPSGLEERREFGEVALPQVLRALLQRPEPQLSA